MISGIIIGSCEIYLMSHGIKSWYSLLGPIRGYRIGFSVIFIANGILCCILLKLNAKKKWIILITLFLTIVSLVMSRYGFKWNFHEKILLIKYFKDYNTLQYLIALYTRLFFWQKNPPYIPCYSAIRYCRVSCSDL